MARVERFLERLRPAGTPGGAAASGVPADRVAELAAELGPVLSRLDAVQARCERLRSDAAVEADRRRRAAADQARQILAEARAAADGERAAAAAAVERRVTAEVAAARLDAEQAADAVRRLAATRMDALVDRVVGAVRALADEQRQIPEPAEPARGGWR